MSQRAMPTPLWDARHRLTDLADRSRPDEDLEVTATGDPELFRFRTDDGRVEGFARIVEVDLERRCSMITVTGDTLTSSGSAVFKLIDQAAELVSDGPAAEDVQLDRATAAAWLEALNPPTGSDADVPVADALDASDTGGFGAFLNASWARPVTLVGMGAFVLAATAWWWRSRRSVSTRAGG